MGRTILCPHCKSTFDENVLAKRLKPDMCPVCENSLLGDSGESSSAEVLSFSKGVENPDLYFYDIDEEEEYNNDDLRDVWCQCTSCRKVITIPYSQFDIVQSKYLRLKENLRLTCEGCGKAINSVIIPKRPDGWKDLDMWTKDCANLPKCPICNSTKIHKISMADKAASAIAFGVLAAGHVSKTYKCDICGAKF